MKKIIKLIAAFCVATVLAQAIVLVLAGVRGNIKKDTVLKGIALLNGVDFMGDSITQALIDSREAPIPSYEDVQNERASQAKDLDMRETSIRRLEQEIDVMLASLQAKEAAFARRTTEFYDALDKKEKILLDESLKDVQLTLESLGAEQAKEQILLFLEDDNLVDDVVAIIKGMSPEKRSKIMGEFTEKDESTELNKILLRLRQGEPNVGLIRNAREQSAN